MARFHFDLEGVMKQRKNAEQVAQRDVAVLQVALVELQNQLRTLDESVQAVNEDMRQTKLVGSIDVRLVTSHRRYVIAMERKAMELAKRIAEQAAKVARAQHILAAAVRDHKAIEKLRERQFEQWSVAENKRETDLLDEAGMQIAYNNIVNDRAGQNGGASISQ